MWGPLVWPPTQTLFSAPATCGIWPRVERLTLHHSSDAIPQTGNGVVGSMAVPSTSCSGPCNHLCRLDTRGDDTALFGKHHPPLRESVPICSPSLTSMTLPVPPGQAADPGPKAETGEKILPNEGEEGGDAGGVRGRASKGQEHEELPTETTAETSGRHPHLQTSKPGWEGSVCARHPSPAGAAPWGVLRRPLLRALTH